MTVRAKSLDGSNREVFIGVEQGHAGNLFLFFVLPNSRIDLVSENPSVDPRALKVRLSERRKVREDPLVTPALLFVAYERPNGNARSHNAGVATCHPCGLLDS